MSATYNGLFYETNGVWQQSSGIISLKSTAYGSFSAKLTLGAARFSFSGRFDSDGHAYREILRYWQNPLRVQLQVDPNDPDLITGTVGDGEWSADLFADRSMYDGRTSISPDQGNYTMVLLGNYTDTNSPGGHSFGTIKVDKAGRVRFAGVLADGTKVSQSATVSKGGQWPLYVPLYRGWGSMYGWLLFNGSADEDLSGNVTWIKPENWSWYYPHGFEVILEAQGSRYVRPPKGSTVLNLTDAKLEFNGGDLPRNFTNNIVLTPDNKIGNLSANGLQAKISLSNGTISGRVLDPIQWVWLPFRGVVLQRFDSAAGFFPGWDETGEMWLEAR